MLSLLSGTTLTTSGTSVPHQERSIPHPEGVTRTNGAKPDPNRVEGMCFNVCIGNVLSLCNRIILAEPNEVTMFHTFNINSTVQSFIPQEHSQNTH